MVAPRRAVRGDGIDVRWQTPSPSSYRHWIHEVIWALTWLATSTMRRDIRGPVPDAPCIIVSNHLHYLDIPISGRYAVSFTERAHWLAKSELFRVPVVGSVLRGMQAVAVERGKPDRAALERIIVYARRDKVLIFPEGHRSPDGRMQGGKEGVVLIARRSNVPLVPVAIYGTEGGPLPLLLHKKTLGVIMGQPFHLPAGLSRDEAVRFIMDRIADLLPEQYRPLPTENTIMGVPATATTTQRQLR